MLHSGLSVDKRSCKHFCCREGLEKPPRPSKKRATPNEKAPGLNQLTLAASITKQPAPKNLQKPIQSTKVHSAAKGKNSNISAAGSKTQSKRKASNQSLFSGAPIKKANTSKPGEEKPQSPPKSLSSDFGDDDFDELPSPSALFGGTKSSFVVSESPVVETERQAEPEVTCVDPSKLSVGDGGQSDTGGDTAVVDPALKTGSNQAVMATQVSQPCQSSVRTKPIEIWDDLSYGSAENIFTITEYQGSSDTTAPFASSAVNTGRSPKRRTGVSSEDQTEQSQIQSSGKFNHDTFIRSSAVMASDSICEERMPTADDTSIGWEDIDRGMYEEFQHLINFY